MGHGRARRAGARSAGAVLILLSAMITLAGCSSGRVNTTGFTTQTVRMGPHDRLRIEDTAFSPGVGDSWWVIERPSPAVATLDAGHLSDCNKSGCRGTLAYVLTAHGRGTTKAMLQYCYRTSPGPDCVRGPGAPAPPPVVVTVSVS